MKILHFADLHLDEGTATNVEHAIGQILSVAQTERPDVIVNAGDLSMKRGHLAPWVALKLRQFHAALSRIAPTIVVEGNHDLTYSEGRAGTLSGALGASEAEAGRLVIVERPQVVRVPGFPPIACLPYPSKYRVLAATSAGELLASQPTNARIQDGLRAIVRGLAAEAGPGSLLVFHGTIAGATAGSETLMATEIDALLEEPEIPAEFVRVLCGHIHRPQTIGRATYSGSPCPLSFSEEGYEHGVLLWDTLDNSSRFVSLEPARRLVTVDLRSAGVGETSAGHDRRVAALFDKLPESMLVGGLRGSSVRVLAHVGRNEDAGAVRATLLGVLSEADERKVVLERLADDLTIPTATAIKVEGDVGALLELWATRVPEAREVLEDLKAAAREIETRVPLEAHTATNAAEYRVLELAVENWKSFGPGPSRIVYDDLGSLVAIEGENASGKSNLMEAEAFALWGRTLRGRQTLAELVRNGAERAAVSAVFESAGSRWKVTRSIRIRKGGIGVAELSLARAVEPGGDLSDAVLEPVRERETASRVWAPADRGTASETQALIETLVGPLDLYLATRYASQGDVDRLLSMTPGELKSVLTRALNIGAFEERERLTREKLGEPAERATKAAATIAALKSQVESLTRPEFLEVEEKSLADARAELEAFDRDLIPGANASVDRASEALNAAGQRRAELSAARTAVETATTRASRLEKTLEETRARAAEAEGWTQAIEEAKALRAEISALEPLRARMSEAQAEHSAQEIRVRDMRADFVQKRAAVDRRRGEALEHVRKVEQTAEWRERAAASERAELLSRHARAADASAREIVEAERRASLLSGVPFGEKCAEAGCRFVADAAKSRDALEGLKASHVSLVAEHLREAEVLAEKAAAVRREDEESVRKARADADPDRFAVSEQEIADLGEQIRDESRRAEKLAEASREATTAAATLFEKERRLAELRIPSGAEERARELRGHEEAVLRSLSEAREEVAIALERHRSLGEDTYAEAAASLDARRSERDRLFDCRTLATRRVETQAEVVASIKRDAKLRDELAKRIAEHETEETTARRSSEILTLLARAFGKDGIPFLILERAVPALEARANHFLGETTDLRVEIESARDLQSGEQRSEVVVRYRNRFGGHELAAASGFERVALGYALRAALSQVQAEAHGVRVSHWVADEGWGAFDERNLILGQQMLRRLAAEFSRVFFVSHVGAIREVADSRIVVIPDSEAGSFVKVKP